MDTLKRWGTYTFPTDAQTNISDNFAELVTKTSRMPGMHGGFDELGTGPGLHEIGSVKAEFWYEFTDMADARAKLDALKELGDKGVQKLFLQPMAGEERFAWARLDNLNLPQNVKNLPHRRMKVSFTFQVADAAWYSIGTEAWSWGDGTLWGSGAKWGGEAAAQACSGTETTWTETPGGNATTQPRISIIVGSGQTANGVTVQRLVRSVVVDEVKYAATLVAGDRLTINCRDYSVTLNGADAYGNDFSFEHPSWMRLEPGANDMRVLMDNSGDACSVYLRYYEVWR